MGSPFDVAPGAADLPASPQPPREGRGADHGEVVEHAVPLSEAVRREVDACLAASVKLPLVGGFLVPPHPTVVRLAVAVACFIVAFYAVVDTDLTRLGDAAAQFPLMFVGAPALATLAGAVAVTWWRRPVLGSEWGDQIMLWALAGIGMFACAASRAGTIDGAFVLAAWVAAFVQVFHASRSFRVNRAWIALRWPYLVFVCAGVTWAVLAAPFAERLIGAAQR
jgi:hypothetical protein